MVISRAPSRSSRDDDGPDEGSDLLAKDQLCARCAKRSSNRSPMRG